MTETMWLARRAMLAILLMVAFYVLAALIAVGLLWIPYAEWTYLHRIDFKIGLACIVTAVTLAMAVFPRPDRFEPPGPRLDETEQPRLFAELRAVATATRQEMPTDVYLINEVNAWVSNRGGTMGFGGRRVMGIGLPLLQGLTISEFKAVLAHEFGHYAAGDVRLGPWIYKTRAAIGRAMESLSESWLAWIFDAYGKMFMRLTLAISRQQEFLADALAARTVHPMVMASALRRTGGLAPAFATYWTHEVAPALEAGYLPPIATGFNQFLGAPRISEAITRTVSDEVQESESSLYDTHPPLKERLEALNRIAKPNVPFSSEPPAASLLEDVEQRARQLLAFKAGELAVQKLREIGWSQLASDAYPAGWRKTAWHFKEFLSPYTADTLPTDRNAYAKLGSSMPGGGTRSSDERVTMSCRVVAAAVAVALLDAGATVENQPGYPVVFRLRGMTMDPFGEVPRVVKGDVTVAEWQATCHAIGIAGRSLAPLAAEKTR